MIKFPFHQHTRPGGELLKHASPCDEYRFFRQGIQVVNRGFVPASPHAVTAARSRHRSSSPPGDGFSLHCSWPVSMGTPGSWGLGRPGAQPQICSHTLSWPCAVTHLHSWRLHGDGLGAGAALKWSRAAGHMHHFAHFCCRRSHIFKVAQNFPFFRPNFQLFITFIF